MVALIILNIILIILLIFLVIYLFRNKKGDAKNICTNDEECDVEICEYEKKKNKKTDRVFEKTDRVFEGRFVTDEEYLQIKNSKRSDISILLEEVNSEYEHLKELNK
jgi:hypothetical protein